MENLYYYIIIFAIIIEYLLSTTSSILDIKNITSTIPSDFKKAYDQEKYILSQDYLKARTSFGLFSSSLSLILIMIVIHSDIFGLLDQFVRGQSDSYILQGLLFIGVIYFFQDIVSLPFSIYHTFVIEERFGFNKTTLNLFIIDKMEWLELCF